MSTFSASGVLSSSVDYFCLVCESRLRDEEDAIAHVAKPVHTKNFLTTEYFGNKQECVRKIKRWYLCELCNELVATAGGVRLHVAGAQHAARRAGRELRRRAGRVLAFARVQLEDSAWNGIVDDTCAVCNTEFDDEHIHRNETSHILKLIQTKVEYDENQNLYRQVDGSSFQCLTCNMVFALSSIDEHFSEIEHKDLYQRCCDNYNLFENIASSEITEIPKCSENNNNRDDKVATIVLNTNLTDKSPILKSENATIKDKENVEKESILNDIEKFQKNNININLEIETAVCKKCSKQLDFNSQAIENHIQEHEKIKNKDQKQDRKEKIQLASGLEITKDIELGSKETMYSTPVKVTKKEKQEKIKDTAVAKIKKESSPLLDVDELEKYTEHNHMTYIVEENRVHCNKCNIDLTPSMKTAKEHVAGVGHKKKLNEELAETNGSSKSKLIDKEANLLKIPTMSFIVTTATFDGLQKEIIINDKLCIKFLSFLFMVKQNNRLICLVCDNNTFVDNIQKHLETHEHKNIMDKSLVVIGLDNEFITEYKPGCYHCGHCNTLCESWAAMETHLQTVSHRNSKMAAEWRLQQLLPRVIRKREADA